MATPQEEQSAILRLQAQGLTRQQAESIVNPTYAPNFSPIEPTSYGNQVPGQASLTNDYNQAPDFTPVSVAGNQVPGTAAITTDFNQAPDFTPIPVDPDSKQGEPGGFDTELFKQQANIRDIEATSDDWRFRMRLAPRSTAFYKSGEPGILQPLVATDGVIFPYTPQVMINYQANYSESQPTHSNYKQYFYQSSAITDIQITADFTAQSTREADYLMATIHFIKACTKMFYGQDPNRGAPPPLVYLDGFGEHQFNDMPCVVQQFNYVLPPDVDYVRTSGDSGTATIDLSGKRVGSGSYKSPLTRLFDLFSQGIGKGGGARNTQYGNSGSLSRGKQNYVPTKIQLAITLLPIVTRKKQATEFSLEKYASGDLLSKRGIW